MEEESPKLGRAELAATRSTRPRGIFSGLVLGCIETDFCKKICVWQHFSSSTRFAHFCTAPNSTFEQKGGFKNQQCS